MGIGATAQILVVDDSNTDRTHLCQLLAELGDRRPKSLYLKRLVTNSWSPFDAAFQCEIRCHLRADVDEHIRCSPDVASSGMFGFGGHPRTVVEVGAGS